MSTAPCIRFQTHDGESVSVTQQFFTDHARADLTVDLGDARISAGLINAHDHLHRNHIPRLGRPFYENAYDWGNDIHAHDAARIAAARRLPRRDALLFGALKNLLSGVTVVVHHDRWEADFERDFPIRVPRIRHAHSLGLDRDRVFGSPPGGPLWLHLAEGIDRGSAEEIRILHHTGYLDDQTVAVHVVGADAAGIRLLRAARAAVVWCPTSNLYLYGRTAPAALLADGIDVMIGSDALVSADGTLLDELRIARMLGLLDDERLLAAVTRVPARRLGLTRLLHEGEAADLVVLRKPVLEASAADVALVMIAGQPRVADVEFTEVFEACGVSANAVRFGDSDQLIAEPLAQAWQRAVDAGAETERICGLSPVVPVVR